jgi:hypothetical protein
MPNSLGCRVEVRCDHTSVYKWGIGRSEIGIGPNRSARFLNSSAMMPDPAMSRKGSLSCRRSALTRIIDHKANMQVEETPNSAATTSN